MVVSTKFTFLVDNKKNTQGDLLKALSGSLVNGCLPCSFPFFFNKSKPFLPFLTLPFSALSFLFSPPNQKTKPKASPLPFSFSVFSSFLTKKNRQLFLQTEFSWLFIASIEDLPSLQNEDRKWVKPAGCDVLACG